MEHKQNTSRIRNFLQFIPFLSFLVSDAPSLPDELSSKKRPFGRIPKTPRKQRIWRVVSYQDNPERRRRRLICKQDGITMKQYRKREKKQRRLAREMANI